MDSLSQPGTNERVPWGIVHAEANNFLHGNPAAVYPDHMDTLAFVGMMGAGLIVVFTALNVLRRYHAPLKGEQRVTRANLGKTLILLPLVAGGGFLLLMIALSIFLSLIPKL